MIGKGLSIAMSLFVASLALGQLACDGNSCQDQCSTGATACQGNTLMTCGDYDGNGCTEWGDAFNCPDSCVLDRCETNCQDQCPGGTRQCVGGGFQVCADSNSDGCTEWGGTQACPTGQTCTGAGQCQAECVDNCQTGQTRCVTGQDQVQTCDCPADGCCDWAPATDCPAGQSCSNGACVACTDDCTPFGARQCADDSSYQVCGNIDADACNEWSTPTACAAGEVCLKGSCTAPCTDECIGVGVRACTQDNKSFTTCGNFDTDPCLEYGDAKRCAPTEICSEGVCIFNCADECAAGEKRCLGNGYQTCGNFDEDPCTDWSVVAECKHNEICSNGVCDVTCQDECNSMGATECSGFQSLRECGNFDHDPCLDWGPPESCNLWERCLDVTGPASCEIICLNECEQLNLQQCAGDGYQVCGDFDWDACLEWGDVVECGQGELCSNGSCSSMPCEDDCDSEGASVCYLDVGFRTCGYFDSDNCLDWSSVTECGASLVCQNGQCTAACTDTCTANEKGCTDNDTRWVCNDANGDGCLEQVQVNCPANQTCSAGVCSTGCADDNYEPNDEVADAYTLLAEGTIANLVICAEDDDWFEIQTGSDEGLTVSIAFDHAAGDLDLELYELADLTQPIAVSAGISDTETVVAPGGPANTYYVRVLGFAGAENSYSLTLNYVAQGECLDDYLEPNDSQQAANFVLDDYYADLWICGDNEDWYENYMFVDELLVVDLYFAHADGDIDVEIVAEDGTVLQSGDSTSDNEMVEQAISVEGSYFVHVYGYDSGLQTSYDMAIAYESASTCEDTDQFAPNHTIDDAELVTFGTYQSLILCPGTEDWFGVILDVETIMPLFGIDFVNANGDLDLYLYDENEQLIDWSESVGNSETVGADVLPAGLYYIKVVGYDGVGNDYSLDVAY